MAYWYVPTAIEWIIVAGLLAFGALIFTISVLILPMQEAEAH
jgi:Ni/Fe-hydrogenase subunit HybB-like protein